MERANLALIDPPLRAASTWSVSLHPGATETCSSQGAQAAGNRSQVFCAVRQRRNSRFRRGGDVKQQAPSACCS